MRPSTVVKRAAAVALSAWLACGHAAPASAYQTFGVRVGTQVVQVKWSRLPVRYFVTDRGTTGVTATQFRDAATRAFGTRQGVASASVSATFAGFTSAEPDDEDNQNTLGFASRPDLARVLGSTSYFIDDTTGEILEADIFFNSTFPWSVSSSGEAGRFDLESIILHETGHLFGLGHSSLGETELVAGGGRRVIAAESVMFPIAFSTGIVKNRTPRADDIAGLSEVYPGPARGSDTGALTGRVTRNGQGLFGAHVVALNPATGVMVGNFTTDTQGNVTVTGLSPGPYIVRVEPVDDADLDSFFDLSAVPMVDISFRVTFAQSFVVVPKGGASKPFEIKVIAK
jgi:hypothetical protein